MNPVIQFQTHRIIIRTRCYFDFLTCGKWRSIRTLDFSQGTIEEKTLRFAKITVQMFRLRAFDAVDYSYELLAAGGQNGVIHEFEEYRVGLRYKSTRAIFPLASFRGTVSTPTGLGALLASILPPSWSTPNIRHEVEARSLANLLCDKLDLDLAD
jgi:hypothetical protein